MLARETDQSRTDANWTGTGSRRRGRGRRKAASLSLSNADPMPGPARPTCRCAAARGRPKPGGQAAEGAEPRCKLQLLPLAPLPPLLLPPPLPLALRRFRRPPPLGLPALSTSEEGPSDQPPPGRHPSADASGARHSSGRRQTVASAACCGQRRGARRLPRSCQRDVAVESAGSASAIALDLHAVSFGVNGAERADMRRAEAPVG